jgi:plastocyanin
VEDIDHRGFDVIRVRIRNYSALLIVFISMLLCLAAKAKETAALTAHARPDASFRLLTGIAQGKMVFIGKGGEIDGQVNPTLVVHEGDVVLVTLINGEGVEHDIVIPDLHASSQRWDGPGASSTLVFHATDIGAFAYFCSVPGHREAGTEGLLKVEPAVPKAAASSVSISRDPSDLPPPVGAREPTTVRFDLEAVERVGRLAPQRESSWAIAAGTSWGHGDRKPDERRKQRDATQH